MLLRGLGFLLGVWGSNQVASAATVVSLLSCEQVFLAPSSTLYPIDWSDPNLEWVASNETRKPGFIQSYIDATPHIHWVHLKDGLSFRFAFGS